MNRAYPDLLAMCSTPPAFFQAGGVPRWAPFDPRESTGVYAAEAAVIEIACQSCDARFHVLVERRSHKGPEMADLIAANTLAYGDPPNVGCCAAGPSMTSETVRVLEHWTRGRGGLVSEWTRHPENEVAFRRWDDPMDDGMRARVQEMADDADAPAEARENARLFLESDDERRTRGPRPPALITYTRYATTARKEGKDAGETPASPVG